MRRKSSKSTPPQAVGLSHGLIEQVSLRVFGFFVALDVFADHFRRHLVAHGSGEVAVFPELAAPQLALDRWELAEHGARTQTLEHPDHLRYRVARRERAEQVHVIGADLHLVYRNVIRVGDLCEHLLDSHRQSTFEYLLAVLRRPH
jgi:hypothetical protein